MYLEASMRNGESKPTWQRKGVRRAWLDPEALKRQEEEREARRLARAQERNALPLEKRSWGNHPVGSVGCPCAFCARMRERLAQAAEKEARGERVRRRLPVRQRRRRCCNGLPRREVRPIVGEGQEPCDGKGGNPQENFLPRGDHSRCTSRLTFAKLC